MDVVFPRCGRCWFAGRPVVQPRYRGGWFAPTLFLLTNFFMPLACRCFLCLAALLTVMWPAAAQTPTSVRQPVGDVYVDAQGVLRWQQNKQEVALFGVNYTAPCVEYVELSCFCGMVLEAVHFDIDSSKW